MKRSDGRAPDEMRPVSIDTGYLLTAEGSVVIQVGNTRVRARRPSKRRYLHFSATAARDG